MGIGILKTSLLLPKEHYSYKMQPSNLWTEIYSRSKYNFWIKLLDCTNVFGKPAETWAETNRHHDKLKKNEY